MKRMKHPDHGFHNAYTTQEEELLRKSGWVADVPEVKASEEEAAPDEPVKRGPGRPPKA